MLRLLLGLAIAAYPLYLSAQDGLQTQAVTASSYMQTATATYGPENVMDGDLKTWWTPAAPASNGSNSWLELQLAPEEGEAYVVTHIDIHPGSHYPNYPGHGDLFKKNLRLRQAKLEFSDGTTEEIYLQDEDRLQRIALKAPHTTTWVRLIPKAVYTSEKWNDLCISAFYALGYVKLTQAEPELEQVPISQLIGAWYDPTEPCQDAYRVVWLDDAGRYYYLEAYLMDAIEGLVQAAYVDNTQDPPLVRLDVVYGGADEASEVLLTQYSQNALSPELLATATQGQLPLEVYLEAHRDAVYAQWIVGWYVNASGDKWGIGLNSTVYNEAVNGTLSYEMMGLYGNCGELKVTWEDGTEGYFGVSFEGGQARIFPIECGPEVEGEMPDCNLAATPWVTKTN